LLGGVLVLPEIHEAQCEPATVPTEVFVHRCVPVPLLFGGVSDLERFRQPPKMPPGEGGKPEPDCEQSGAAPLGHVEVDATLQSSSERRVRAQTLPETECTGGVLHVEFDSLR
jgi:hypothetical protein